MLKKRIKWIAMFEALLIVSIVFSFSGLVSGQKLETSTCLEDNKGAICQEYLSDSCDKNCKDDCFPGAREDIAECRIGVCFDDSEGTCSENSPKIACESDGGEWFAEKPAKCNKICCLYNKEAEYITERECERREQTFGVDAERENTESELECLIKIKDDLEGACVFEVDSKRNCVLTNENDCLIREGEFFSGFLCSAEELNTICEKQKKVGCVDGKDEVYWFDSCGNKENIYDANRIKSYNKGKLFLKSQSCELSSGGNPLGKQESCGNCDSFRGSICGIPGKKDKIIQDNAIGNFVCKDLRCIDSDGNVREDKESWCIYEGAVGFHGEGNEGRSVDIPGSRHFRKVCNGGEIQTVPCEDFRNEICVESPKSGEKLGISQCIKNNWQSCIDYNLEKDKNKMRELCEKDGFCEVKEVNIDSGFAFNTCVPRFPPGFDLNDERSKASAESVCGIASASCQIVYVKKLSGSRECKKNCNCRTNIFSETMNNLCISLGDCGGYYNLLSDFTKDGYGVGGKAPDLRDIYIESLKEYLNANGKFVLAEDFGIVSNVDLAFESLKSLQFSGVDRGGFSNNELEVFKRLSQNENLGESAALYAGNVIILATFGLILGPLGLLVGLAFSWIIVDLLGIGESKTRISTFQCLPWVPPAGGDECEKCKNFLNGCSKYKCQSLGQTCKFENEGTKDEICLDSNPGDIDFPIIQPDINVKTQGFDYFNVNNNGFSIRKANGECIPEFASVEFGIKLNEPGRCKYDAERTDKFDDMGLFFRNSNSLKERHSETLRLPSLDLLEVDGIDPERTGDYNLYLRCIDSNGNTQDRPEYVVNFCVAPGVDNTSPILGKFKPITDSFVALEAIEKEVEFYANEPAECRWSETDIGYESMKNQIDCDTDISEMGLFGWQCKTILPFSSVLSEQNYFIRCKDQPWLDDPEFEGNKEGKMRNVNAESVRYKLVRSASELSIFGMKPDNQTIFSRNEPAPLTLEIQTEGGVDGTAICEFEINQGFSAEFFDTGSVLHRQKLSSGLNAGKHEVDYMCVDIAGNEARKTAKFDITIDDVGPIITRVYDKNRELHIITNENSVCAFSFSSCDFDFTDSDVMEMTGEQFVHTAGFDKNLIHYIKCEDEFENVGACLTIRGGFV